jgi:Interleukin-like EMT inducer
MYVNLFPRCFLQQLFITGIFRAFTRGFLLVPVDPVTCTTLTDVVQFDLLQNDANIMMVSYIANVTNGTVLAAITMVNPALSAAQNQGPFASLTELGLSVGDVPFRGSIAFVVQKGYSNKTLYSKSLISTQTSAVLSAMVITGELMFSLDKNSRQYLNDV